jgi:hypothetical protein
MGNLVRCPGSGGAPSFIDKSAVQKTTNKHYGKPIYSIACVVCGQRFNSLSKIGPVPEHNEILRSRAEPQTEETVEHPEA